jgi:ectoine hydroxylase-related dioxygenase (phytanoyl-CoA dioxygenase family)
MNSTSSIEIPQFSDDPQKALHFYREYGFQIELNIWSQAEIIEINEQADKIDANISGNFSSIIHGDRISPPFLKNAKNPKIIAIIESLLGGRVSGLQTVYYFGKPGTKGFPLHQDNFFVQSHRDMFATAWSPFIDVNPSCGCLIAYPGSHREAILEVTDTQFKPDLGDPQSPGCILPSSYLPMAIDAPKGSCVFLHGHMAHSSCDNTSEIFRRTFLTTYIKEGANFRAGRTERKPIQIYD